MKLSLHTPLDRTVSDASLVRQLATLWITSGEELIGLRAALESSRQTIAGAEAIGSTISKAAASAQETLPKDRIDRVSVARPGGSLGCLLDADIVEDFKQHGTLRRSQTRPVGAFEDRLPPAVRLMDRMPPVKNQGGRGTCVAFGTVALREFLLEDYAELSEQFLYWACKQLDGIPGPGTYLHTAVSALAEYGVCRASVWPYNSYQTDDEGQGPPPNEAFSDAREHILSAVRMVEPGLVTQYKHILAGAGGAPPMPISFATLVFDSWYMSPETHRTGKITMPLPGERPVSGHAWCVVGYVDDPEVPGGGYFIVRNSWGPEWAADSPESAGHAVMPYAYVSLCAVEAFTGPAVEARQSREKSEDQWEPFLRMLDRDERDVDGRLVKPGTRVLCHPMEPGAFRVDSEVNRQQFLLADRTWTPEARRRVWFPPISQMLPGFAGHAAACHSAKEAFLSALDENLVLARGKPMPEFGTVSRRRRLLPWEPRIKEVMASVDLTQEIVTQLLETTRVPQEVSWPQDWLQKLTDWNSLKVYVLKSSGSTIHVVVAFLTSLHFRPERHPEFGEPSQEMVDLVYRTYAKWRVEPHGSAFAFMTYGAAGIWPEHVVGQATSDRCVIISGLGSDGRWDTRTPPRAADELSFQLFLERLKPETRQQRISKIEQTITDLLGSGYDGNLHVKKIAKATGYDADTVRDAFMSLHRSGRYRMYKTVDNMAAVERRKGSATSD